MSRGCIDWFKQTKKDKADISESVRLETAIMYQRRNADRGRLRTENSSSTTMKEDIETQLDSLEPPDFMSDIEGMQLSVPTIAALVFGLTGLIVAIVAGAMLGQFYRTQLNRNTDINADMDVVIE